MSFEIKAIWKAYNIQTFGYIVKSVSIQNGACEVDIVYFLVTFFEKQMP